MSINFKFYSGFSSGDSVGKDGSYLYSENINTLNPEFIQVSPKVKNILKTDEKIDYLVFDTSKRSDLDFSYVSGLKIINADNSIFRDLADGVNNSDTALYNKLYFAVRTRECFVCSGPQIETQDGQKIFTRTGIFCLFPNQESIKGFTNLQIYGTHKQVNFDVLDFSEYLYFSNENLFRYKYGWDGNQLRRQSIEGGATAISRFSSGLKIFSSDGKINNFALNNSGTDIGKVIDLYELNIDILTVRNFSGIDYIFCKQGLFFLNGIIASPIFYKTKSSYLDFEKFDFCDIKWKFLIIGKFIYSITKTKKGFDLNVLGSEVVGSPINFSSIVSLPYQELTSIIKYKEGLLISYKDFDGKYGIDYFSFENEKNETGWIMTKEYSGKSKIYLKYAKEIKLYCDKLKAGEYLKIFVSINNSEFEEIKTLTENDRWKNGYFSILDFKREFHKIVFKLELKGDFKLYDFIFLDNENG